MLMMENEGARYATLAIKIPIKLMHRQKRHIFLASIEQNRPKKLHAVAEWSRTDI